MGCAGGALLPMTTGASRRIGSPDRVRRHDGPIASLYYTGWRSVFTVGRKPSDRLFASV